MTTPSAQAQNPDEHAPVPTPTTPVSTEAVRAHAPEPPAGVTLVIGGTGKTGRRVTERLAMLQLPVRVGSRWGEPPFDWQRPETWHAALEGVTDAYVTYHPDLSEPEAAERVGRFARLAVRQGVRRLVLLSGRGEEGARVSELALREAGADWTVIRASWFNQNFDEDFFLDAVRAGELAFPVGDSVEPFVDAEDIADVAVAALTQPGHGGRTYELSGPRLLGFHEVAAILSEAVGREITYVPVTIERFRETLCEQGLPVVLAELFHLIEDGRNAHLTDGVRRALGRPPRDFGDYARQVAATGVWSV